MTTYLIVDAGIVIKLIIPHAHQQVYIDLVDQWQQAGYQLCAPSLWAYEVVSTFAKLVHFGHLSAIAGQDGLRLAFQLGVELVSPDEALAHQAFAWAERLQRAAAYDGFYLALSETLGAEMWTVDRRLANAVAEPWLRLVEETT